MLSGQGETSYCNSFSNGVKLARSHRTNCTSTRQNRSRNTGWIPVVISIQLVSVTQ